MKPRVPHLLRLPAAALLAALLAAAAHADVITLKSGEKIQGTITNEDSTSVTIRTQISESIKILDNKRIPRTDIAKVEKQTPEDVEAAEVKAMIPADDFLLPSAYTQLIERGPDKFLAKYPNSRHKADILKVKEELQKERNMAQRGMRKVAGQWLSPLELQANEYNIRAMRRLSQMKKMLGQNRYREALIAFRELEQEGKLSVHYPEALALAREALQKYENLLAELTKRHPILVKEREKELTTLNPSEKRAAEAEREKQRKALQAQLNEEKKAKIPFTSVVDHDLPSIQEASRQVTEELKRVSAIDERDIKQTAEAYEKILKLIAEQKYEEASLRLEQFLKNNKAAAADPVVQNKIQELKKLRETQLREQRRQELLDRSQSAVQKESPAAE